MILTIEPGTYVELQDYYTFYINGTLIAEGAEGDTITFTVSDTTGWSNFESTNGGWSGIEFNNASGIMNDNDSSFFKYCKFLYAKSEDVIGKYSGGALYIFKFSKLSIENCLFYKNYAPFNGGGIWLRDANIRIASSLFRENYADYGGAVNIYSGSPTFINNHFKVNLAIKGGGAIYIQGGGAYILNNEFEADTTPAQGSAIYISGQDSVIIRDNHLYNNSSRQSVIYVQNRKVLIEKNDLHDNTSMFDGTAITLAMGSKAKVLNNDISYNSSGSSGAAIYVWAATAVIDNNRIFNNSSNLNGGAIMVSNGSMELINNDIHHNSAASAGGAIFIIGGTHILDNNRIYGNTSGDYGGGISLFQNSPIVRNCLIANNYGYEGGAISFENSNGVFQNNIIANNESPKGGAFTFYGSSPLFINNTVCNNKATDASSGGAMYVKLQSTPNLYNSIFYENISDTDTNQVCFTSLNPIVHFFHCVIQGGIDGFIQPPGSDFYGKYENGFDTIPSLAGPSSIAGNAGDGNGTIIMTQSDPVISNCTIINNNVGGQGGGIMIDLNSNPVIMNNVICDNVAEGDGGALAIINNSAPDVLLNHISNNRGLNGGGIYSFRSGHTGSVINNIIPNNSAAQSGGGIYMGYSDPPFISNTITNNQAGTEGGGVYLDGNLTFAPNPPFTNSIIWGNQDAGGLNQVHIRSGEGSRFTYSNIQGGLESFTQTFTGDWVKVYENNIDSVPMFRNETPGPGADFSTIPGDWYIESNSPAINAGTPELSGLGIPEKDLLGNGRIHANQIDIGAIENQDGEPDISVQPGTLVKCEGENAFFKIQTNDSVFYQWQKDGIDIPGAIHAKLLLDSIQINDEGNYSCIITNSYGSAFSNPAYLYVKEKPSILQGPADTWAKPDAPAMLETFAQGSDLKYQWLKDSLGIPGANIPKFTISHPGFNNEGMYRCIIYNTCEADTTPPASLYMVPQICLVTVNPTKGNNLVVWEKKSGAPLVGYNIYREGTAAGLYDLIGTVTYNDLSIFVDTTADPTVQAYIYKITGIDTSGYETDPDLCNPHKTIHLLVSTNPEFNTTQLEWDKYYGFTYQTYIIYRSESGTNFEPIREIASSLSSWTDVESVADVVFYRIAVLKPDPCFPTGSLKADTGPYSHSMSNIEDNRLQVTEENEAPTDILLNNNTINENQSVGALVGRLQTTDANFSDHHTYKLVAGQGDKDNNRFTTLGDLLISAEIFDYETQDTFHIRVKSTDKGDLFIEKEFIVVVNDVYEGLRNQAPTDITLSFNTIDENKMVGTLIGRFQTDDPDVDDVHSYKFVEGLGGDNNNSFSIIGDLLISAEVFDFETMGQLTIRVRSIDNGDGRLSFEKIFTIYVNDIIETGLKLQEDQNLTISPNPFTDRTIIIFNNPAREKYRFVLTDLTGKILRLKDNIYADEIEFERTGLPPGCYIFELRGPKLIRGNLLIE